MGGGGGQWGGDRKQMRERFYRSSMTAWVCTCVYVYVGMHIHLYMYVCICMYTQASTCVYSCVHLCLYMYARVRSVSFLCLLVLSYATCCPVANVRGLTWAEKEENSSLVLGNMDLV